jgi:putative sigma-54 modulation protein
MANLNGHTKMQSKSSTHGRIGDRINIQVKNCEVDDELYRHIEERMEHLERLGTRSDDAQLRLVCERGRHSAEMTLQSGGLLMRGEERAATLRGAIDGALEKLERQLNRYKKKLLARDRRHDNRDDVAGEVIKATMPAADLNGASESDAASDEDVKVLRVKRFALKPMSAEEAALQMGLLGHEFFVFRDAESNQTSVVYRRGNGGYGLIEPVAD